MALALMVLVLAISILFPVLAYENLIYNGDLELGYIGPIGWYLAGYEWSDSAFSGSKCLKVVGDGTWKEAGLTADYLINISPNTKYVFIFYAKGENAQNCFLILNERDKDNNVIKEHTFNLAGTYAWTPINYTFQFSPNTVKVGIYTYCYGGGGSLYLDNFMMYQIEEENNILYEIMFGSLRWITLTIITLMIIAIASKYPKAGPILLIIIFFLGFEYLRNTKVNDNFIWGILAFLFSSIYVIYASLRGR